MRLMDEMDEIDEVVCIRVYCTTTVRTYIYLQAVFQGANDALVAGSSPVATPYSPYQPLTSQSQPLPTRARAPINVVPFYCTVLYCTVLYWYWWW